MLVAELAAMTPDAERFDAKTIVLIENVTHHMDEEEQDWFPKVRAGLGRKQLQHPWARMMELKKTAPTSPAQRTPTRPLPGDRPEAVLHRLIRYLSISQCAHRDQGTICRVG